MADFRCSIETEPNQGQLHHAKEVAIDIVQKKEADEVSSIFIDGLKPVVAIKNMTVVISEQKVDETKEKTQIMETSFQCSLISASLPQPSLAAKVSEKKRSGKRSEALTPEELKNWVKDLPTISHRLAYSEILDLKMENKLKHVIKPPNTELKQRPEVVLAVLEDNKVVRIVLPSIESDPNFWEQWDELKVDGICVNAYSPPLKKPEIPRPYLGFLSKIPVWMFSLVKPKPQSKKALELKRMREEFKQRKNEELNKYREEREMMEKAIKMQKKIEEKKKRQEMKKIKYEESLRQARRSSQDMAIMWQRLASDSNIATALGLVFFYIFYRTVVLSYRKQKKDYEDRLKIEKAEAEEKKKMRELEREMAGIEDDDDDEEGGKCYGFGEYGNLTKAILDDRLPLLDDIGQKGIARFKGKSSPSREESDGGIISPILYFP
ncbi:probable inactive ATP-dependent zinc metalloprotease FTSHI 2, chloroplastic [Olea europaea subsp. europaea]|uniref:Probable inactive ATP-dependent zinc metalloprotease FTSHI 2, chloroplastic n=1 Tax=Olea europaea subsp. europaea TaxID=158383 RepID=A0A8S0PZV9_OLEEU|nr:probable inactive ATP-dependent zinc metalloprotease FTSHI 2, chloroplastic [Olea europaea subsp. europaea]